MLRGTLGGAPFRDTGQYLGAHAFEVVLMILFFLSHPWDDARRVRIAARTLPPLAVGAVILMGVLLVIALGSGSSAQFIYFEF